MWISIPSRSAPGDGAVSDKLRYASFQREGCQLTSLERGSSAFDRDVRGYRKVFGVIGPSTNTIVQPDFDDMRVPGVTNHYSRIIVDDAEAISDETFMAGTHRISENTLAAVEGALSARPDALVMGMSAVTFYGGATGAAQWRERIQQASGLGVTTGAHALIHAFEAYGGIKRIGLLSPYYPSANTQVSRFMADYGVSVVRDICLRCPSWTAIARVSIETLRHKLNELNGSDVDALVQVGTNLSMVRLAAAAELYLGKPVIAINAATYWSALRSNGIDDRVEGLGALLEHH
jgi:maleate isomerase